MTSAQRHAALGFDDTWLIALGIPLLSAVTALLFAQVEYDNPLSFEALGVCFVIGLGYTGLYWSIIRAVIIQLRRVGWLRERVGWRLALSLGMAFLLVLIVQLAIKSAIATFGHNPTDVEMPTEAPVTFSIILSTILCVMMIAIYEFIYFFAKYRDGLVAQEQLVKLQMQSQLVSLRDQVNPHFLFNSLNTLASIIPEDPETATKFVQRLSAVYRRVLEHGGTTTVTLADELRALDDYLFLMRTRFEDKLRVSIVVDPEMRLLHVVPLSLQMLVENAIKHNIVSHERPLEISIEAEPTYVRVTNILQLRAIKEDSTGIGLTNIRERYRLLGAYAVDITETASAYAVELPLLPAQIENYVEA